MGFLGKFFGGSKDSAVPNVPGPLKTMSQCKTRLVPALVHASYGTVLKLMDRFPEDLAMLLGQSESPDDDWYFFFIAGGVGLAFQSPQYTDRLRKEILRDTTRIARRMHSAIDDLIDFLQERLRSPSDTPAIVGMWVIWNIAGEVTSYDECKYLALAIGHALNEIVTDSANQEG